MTFTRKDDVFKIFRKLSGPRYVPYRQAGIAKVVDSVRVFTIGCFPDDGIKPAQPQSVQSFSNNCDG
jgi:hypothetical protein